MLEQLFFDKEDHELLYMINEAIDSGSSLEQKFFDTNLHPHGIVELTTSHEFRVAHAVINLLGSLEVGQAQDRLLALRTLRDEVLHSARTSFRYNTGRVLIQIMKDIVRSRKDEAMQLQLVHNFRRAAKGNPRVVRQFMNKYMLIEMPEDWNQLTLDHHVHDAHTKGRKNSTHLIMDAWVKGIRYITVIYYNYVEDKAARELLQAAEIMGIAVRLGLEFRSNFRGRYVSFVWAPRGFSDPEDFLHFLAEAPVQAMMNEGRKASLYHTHYVLSLLENWNKKHKDALQTELDMPLGTWTDLSEESFLLFVGAGQASSLHLAEFIHKNIMSSLVLRSAQLQTELEELEAKLAQPIAVEELQHLGALRLKNLNLLHKMNALTSEIILDSWLSPGNNSNLPHPSISERGEGVPEILTLSPAKLLEGLTGLRSGYRVTLQLADLDARDVLELLWDCRGMITHLELFNMKEWQEGHLQHLKEINELQLAINQGTALALKQILRAMIRELEADSSPKACERCDKFKIILRNIPILQAPYKVAPLRERIGTDSTSHSSLRHGMGLAVLESLPRASRRQLSGNNFKISVLPVQVDVSFHKTFFPHKRGNNGFINWLTSKIRSLPGFSTFGFFKCSQWQMSSGSAHIVEAGNVIAMGGISGVTDNGLLHKMNPKTSKPTLTHLNTHVSNLLKVLLGFIPAALAFYYTQSDWFLAYFGAVVWFAITWVRNIVQAILGGGGIYRSSLLRWNNYVDWSRICDSLLYTGLSVLLLEWIIRSFLLQNTFNLSVENDSILIFTVIAVANGFYISLHNIYRGFPKEAIIGNLFRSVLSIPVSILYYDILLLFVTYFNIDGGMIILQQGAAITAKAASDTVAGLIEGVADLHNNRRLRYWDYKTKLDQFFDCYAKIELAFPDHDIGEVLVKPKEFMRLTNDEAKNLQTESIINSLDLMYFWFYQPYAQQTLAYIVRDMTKEERQILATGQNVLVRFREVSQLFVDGLLGKHFAKALSFYLAQHEEYLIHLKKSCGKK